MSASNAIAALTAVLKGLPVTGPNVYDQVRYAREDGVFDNLFLDSATNPQAPFIHTWMVTREGTRGVDKVMQAAAATHQVVATGFRGFQDNISEPLWQAELDAIFATLIPYAGRHLQTEGNDQYMDWSGPPVIEGVKQVWFGKYLCHTARVVFPVEEFPL